MIKPPSLWKRLLTRRQTTRSGTIKFMFPMIFGALVIFGASVISSDKSYVKLISSQSTVMQGENFSIKVYANANVPVNAVDVSIQFSQDKVEVLGVNKGESVLTVWTEEPSVKNGLIKLSGGTFKRGFLGEHLIATINAKALISGQTEFLVQNAVLLAGDGLGTSVSVDTTKSKTSSSFYIYDQSEDPSKISAKLALSINADIDGDGNVSLKDVSAFMSNWYSQNMVYDFNADGKMNFVDFSIILAKSFLD